MKTLKLIPMAIWLLMMPFIVQAQHPGNANNFLKDSGCHAGFTIVLDSLSTLPYRYVFTDISTGDIDSWAWDFGDGNISVDQNPVHRYEEPGNYQVCLTVSSLSNPDTCNDQICQAISTREYFSLGGLVYAGDYPLNNPVLAGDTAIAYLYRAIGEQLLYMDEHIFSDYGYYGFGFLLPGSYVVKIILQTNSSLYNSYFPTYSGDVIRWQHTSAFTLTHEDIYSAEIHLVPVRFVMSGTGIIRGQVKFVQGQDAAMMTDTRTTVILYDHTQTPTRFTVPDPDGNFEFAGLPFGTYFLNADATGKPSTLVTVTLSTGNPVAEGINLTVFGPNVQGIPDQFPNGITFSPIYPNPVRDMLNLRINAAVHITADLCITDIAGREFYHHTVKIVPGQNHLQIPVEDLPKAIYLLRLQPHDSYSPVTGKFIK
ncbi:MAG: PKD domain-containing protein [Bacteroidales bacterium]|nr:PKD domain-containing protein [Bacteroidales bacterium]